MTTDQDILNYWHLYQEECAYNGTEATPRDFGLWLKYRGAE